MNLRKTVGPLLAILLLIGVGIAIVYSMKDRQAAQASNRRAANRITVRVLTGSEKEKFLTDAELAKVLEREGIQIVVQKAGSREIATRPDLTTFEAACRSPAKPL